MQLTRAADYAVRVMLHLASQPEGAVVSRSTLAHAADVPESFLSKILQAMARAGLIQARRGVVGGFTLLPKGAAASMLDVVESIDGPVTLNLCLSHSGACRQEAGCAARQVWVQAQSAMVAVLRKARITEMAEAGTTCGISVKAASLSQRGAAQRKRGASNGPSSKRASGQGSRRAPAKRKPRG